MRSILTRRVLMLDLSDIKDPEIKAVESKPVSEYFGELTFNLGHMREKLQRQAYQELVASLEQGKKLSIETAQLIAQCIREWAVSKGATHFCHWFQPLTGLIAEKHDAFISIQHSYHSEIKVIERFSANQLIQGEPDASSFPSGGMRSTFEARGYTAWDPSSPFFIEEGKNRRTLCIPSVFLGYHGYALDLKTPLLRSMQSLNESASAFLKLLGDIDVKRVRATLGAEQEYFLIDRRFAALRPDLLLLNKTLLGTPSTRGQQLEDHYFGSIPNRVRAFMEDLEYSLYRLGIPVKTRHNEVAPSQFEIAPIFEDATIASDHNTLMMETMKRIANQHGLICIFHEKPFSGINGSGKHCNWSLINDKNENLLDPGRTPHQNLRFLTLIAIIVRAVYKHGKTLSASVCSPGNDERLGGNEAPPSILSVFLGENLTNIFNNLIEGKVYANDVTDKISLDVSHLPDIYVDYGDRNRTSPFAFTGTKFEFRTVGASQNIAVPITFLNAAVSSSFIEASHRLEDLLRRKIKRDDSVIELIKELMTESMRVVFNGNNYSKDWPIEARKRKLAIVSNTYDSLKVLCDENETDFLIKTKIFSKEEIAARFNVGIERYNKTITIEISTFCDIVRTFVIGAIEAQIFHSSKASSALKNEKSNLKKKIFELSELIEKISEKLNKLEKILNDINSCHDQHKIIDTLVNIAIPIRDEIRSLSDYAEKMVSDKFWELPKYREILFANQIS